MMMAVVVVAALLQFQIKCNLLEDVDSIVCLES
jgi:hypothetical protein